MSYIRAAIKRKQSTGDPDIDETTAAWITIANIYLVQNSKYPEHCLTCIRMSKLKVGPSILLI